MNKYQKINQGNWRTRLALSGRFLLRWGWFIVLSIIVTTVCTNFIHDTPSTTVYQATLQVQVQLPGNAGFLSDNQSTALYSKLFLDPDTLTFALPRVNSIPVYKGIQESELQGLVTTSAITGTRVFQLSAIGDNPQDAKALVSAVYQAFMDRFHEDHASVINGLQKALNAELKAVQADLAGTNAQLQTLKAEGLQSTFQGTFLTHLYKQQLQLVNTINSDLQTLGQQGTGSNDILQLVNNKPGVTTVPAKAPTQGLRLALSPIVGLIMGLSGALLASQFSNSLPLRGKKREMILPHIASIMPVLPGLNNQRTRLQVLKDTSAESLPLLRRLRFQASEYEQRLRVITVTSPKGQEGKSTVATSLAIAAAQNGLRTILVDANTKRPILHAWFQLPNANGTLDATRSLATGLVGSSPIITTNVIKLGVIPIGRSNQRRPSDSQEELLRINGLQPFTELLSKQADLIIYDAPSLLNDSNAVNLVSLSDVTVLVMDARKSRSSRVLAAEDLLSTLGAPFVTVLNRTLRETVE